MCEINENHRPALETLFGDKAKYILYGDFLDYHTDICFDCVIGNPPHNKWFHSKFTNKIIHQENDGRMMDLDFVKKQFLLLEKMENFLSG